MSGMKTLKMVLCMAFLCLGLFIDDAVACTCTGGTTSELRQSARAVFLAKVASKRKSDAVKEDGVEVTLEVEKVWKGKITKQTIIHTGPTDDLYPFIELCATPFKIGESYIIFAYGKKKLSTDVCAGTGDFPYAVKVIEELGKWRLPLKGKI